MVGAASRKGHDVIQVNLLRLACLAADMAASLVALDDGRPFDCSTATRTKATVSSLQVMGSRVAYL